MDPTTRPVPEAEPRTDLLRPTLAAAPIVVTGAPRTGTTWVGRMLSVRRDVGYIHEPFNLDLRPGWLRRTPPHWWMAVTEENEGEWGPELQRVLSFRASIGAQVPTAKNIRNALSMLAAPSLRYRVWQARPLIKDPFALFSAPWLERRFGARTVISIRHPAGFMASLKRLGWVNNHYFGAWAAQPAVMEQIPEDLRPEVERAVGADLDLVAHAALVWNVVYGTALHAAKDRPDTVTLVRHEDLASDPIGRFRSLYDRLALRWDARVARAIAEHSAPGNREDAPLGLATWLKRDSRAVVRTWHRRLTPGEIDGIRSATESVWPLLYNAEDWLDAAPEPARSSG